MHYNMDINRIKMDFELNIKIIIKILKITFKMNYET